MKWIDPQLEATDYASCPQVAKERGDIVGQICRTQCLLFFRCPRNTIIFFREPIVIIPNLTSQRKEE